MVEALLPLIETGMQGRAKKWPGNAATRGELSKIPEGADRPITQPDLAQAMTDARNKGHNITLMRVCIGWAGDRYHFRTPLDYLGYDGGGGLGAGPGMAIGAALALRGTGRIVASVIGDGDFLQGATSLWTAAHYRIPVLIVIANNRSNFNDEVHQAEVARERGRPLENKWIGMRIDDPAVDLVHSRDRKVPKRPGRSMRCGPPRRARYGAACSRGRRLLPARCPRGARLCGPLLRATPEAPAKPRLTCGRRTDDSIRLRRDKSSRERRLSPKRRDAKRVVGCKRCHLGRMPRQRPRCAP